MRGAAGRAIRNLAGVCAIDSQIKVKHTEISKPESKTRIHHALDRNRPLLGRAPGGRRCGVGHSRVADHYKKVRITDQLSEHWRRRALECRRQIARLVLAHPELAPRDVVLARMIANSRIVEAAGLAAR